RGAPVGAARVIHAVALDSRGQRQLEDGLALPGRDEVLHRHGLGRDDPKPDVPVPAQVGEELVADLELLGVTDPLLPAAGEHEAVLLAVLPRPALVGTVAGVHEPVAGRLAALAGNLA